MDNELCDDGCKGGHADQTLQWIVDNRVITSEADYSYTHWQSYAYALQWIIDNGVITGEADYSYTHWQIRHYSGSSTTE